MRVYAVCDRGTMFASTVGLLSIVPLGTDLVRGCFSVSCAHYETLIARNAVSVDCADGEDEITSAVGPT